MNRTARGMTALAKGLSPLALAYVLLIQSVLGFAAGAQHALRPISGVEAHCAPIPDRHATDLPASPDTPQHKDFCCLFGCASSTGPLWIGPTFFTAHAPPDLHAAPLHGPQDGGGWRATRAAPFYATGPPRPA